MIMKRIFRKLWTLLPSLLLAATTASAQNIDINSGMNEVQGQLDSLFSGILNIAMVLCGIGAVIGLIMAAYNLYTDEHGEGWKTALKWFAGLAFVCIALYVVKTVFV